MNLIKDGLISAITIKLINGRIKPKFGIGAIIAVIIMFIALLLFTIAFIYGLLSFNLEYMIMPLFGIGGFGYLLLINPYLQNANDYYINFKYENSFEGFELFYKNKKVNIMYKVASDGKFAFANNSNKLSCLSYADGTNMSNFTKYKIMNYFSKWLNDYNLLSNEVTTTFEKL